MEQNLKKYIRKYKYLIPLFTGCIAIGVMIILNIYSFNMVMILKSQIGQSQDEVNSLLSKIAIINNNATYSTQTIDEYNQLLTQLIPPTEDYFTMLTAIEKLSQQTGFAITNYTISPATKSPEKISLIIEGDGSPDSFINFLRDYKYAGGRLITNEKIEYSSTGTGKVKLAINFYNKNLQANKNPDFTKITSQDIALMTEVKNKTTVIIKQPEAGSGDQATQGNLDVDYAKTDNPF